MINTVKQKSCKFVEGLYAIIHYHDKAVQLSLVEIRELKTIPGHRLIDTPISPFAVAVYTDTVKCHDVCKCHYSIDTGFKQTERTIFLHVISMG